MVAQINPIFGFLEEVEKLSNFPELTESDTITVALGHFDIINRNPIHSKKYDPRLFDAFTNSLRKLVILSNEPISLEKTHSNVRIKFNDIVYANLNNIYNQIQEYLNKNMNDVTQFSFQFGDSIVSETSVHSLLNNYFAAMGQHSKPNAQRIIDEINILTYGALTEMIRVMMIDISKLLKQYADLLKASTVNSMV